MTDLPICGLFEVLRWGTSRLFFICFSYHFEFKITPRKRIRMHVVKGFFFPLRMHWRLSMILKRSKKSVWSKLFWHIKVCIFWKWYTQLKMSKFYLRQNKRKKKSFFLLQAPIHHSFIGVFQKKKNKWEGERGWGHTFLTLPHHPLPLGFLDFLLYPRNFQTKRFTPRNSTKLCFAPQKC